MTEKYHGTPLTPNATLRQLHGFNFCVPFIRPDNIRVLLEEGIARKVMLDSGAFSVWRRGGRVVWSNYYRWLERWLGYPQTWAVIGDVIDGSEAENDRLIREWPFGFRGAPVWHLNESLEKLRVLSQEWPLVCLGSAGTYRTVGTSSWRKRMDEAMSAIVRPDGSPPTRLHMLRGLKLVKPGWPYPFDSVDSASVARNFRSRGRHPLDLMREWETLDCPTRFVTRDPVAV